MKKLRLLLFKDCNRNCKGCCNKDWDLDSLEIETNFKNYELIMLTGGEPILKPKIIIQTCKNIKKQTNAPIILYTAKTDNIDNFFEVFPYVNGITITLHNNIDMHNFKKISQEIIKRNTDNKSLLLNIFKNVFLDHIVDEYSKHWIIKQNMKWIKNCPLPDNEILKKLGE